MKYTLVVLALTAMSAFAYWVFLANRREDDEDEDYWPDSHVG